MSQMFNTMQTMMAGMNMGHPMMRGRGGHRGRGGYGRGRGGPGRGRGGYAARGGPRGGYQGPPGAAYAQHQQVPPQMPAAPADDLIGLSVDGIKALGATIDEMK